MMERRKGIPLVALIIFVVLLVAIIVTCTIILRTNKNEGTQANVVAQTDVTTDNSTEGSETEEETGTEIESEDELNSDSDLQEVYKLTGNGKTFAKYALYESGGFNTDDDNLSNELKLQLAMAQITSSDMDEESSTKAVAKDTIAEYAETIFEETDDIEYDSFSLYNSDTNFTSVYKTIGYVYDEETDSYQVQENDVTEDTPSLITEVVTKAVKYNSKIEIYVKPIFVETFYSNEIENMGCSIYSSYDFQNKAYENDSLIAIAYTDYENILRSTYNKDLDGYTYSEISSNIDLNQVANYMYTFVETDDGYKLKSFEKVENTNSSDASQELSADEKSEFNKSLELYVGDNMAGSVAESLLDDIISMNEENEDNTNLIVTAKVDDTEAIFDGSDVASLNSQIDELRELIEEDPAYAIKATYEDDLIKTMIITTVN